MATEFSFFDPATGVQGAGFPPPGASGAAYQDALAGQWQPDTTTDVYHQQFDVGDGPPTVGPVPENILGGGDFGVPVEFDSGGDDGFDAGDFGPVADNIVVDDD
jgi:hypothetical protein